MRERGSRASPRQSGRAVSGTRPQDPQQYPSVAKAEVAKAQRASLSGLEAPGETLRRLPVRIVDVDRRALLDQPADESVRAHVGGAVQGGLPQPR